MRYRQLHVAIIPSLAVSGHCSNVASKLVRTCNETCLYTLPGSPQVQWDPAHPIDSDIWTTGGYETFKATETDTDLYNETSTEYFSKFIVLHGNNQSVWVAQMCALWLSVKAYNVTVWNGLLQEGVVAEASAVTHALANDYIQVDPVLLNTPKEFPGFSFTSDDVQVLQKLAAMNETQSGAGSNVFWSFDVAQYMAAIEDWPAWISAYADVLMNTIRIEGGRNISRYQFLGSAHTSEPIVIVRWIWLLYPAILLVLALAVQVLVIRETRVAEVYAWKNNPLPLLFAEVNDDIMRTHRDERYIASGRLVV